MRNGPTPLIVAALVVAAAVAVRARPNGVIQPIPGPQVTGVVPTFAFAAALLIAIIATTAGVVSLVRSPRAVGQIPQAPQFERLKFRLKVSYLWLAIFVLAVALVAIPFAQRNLAPGDEQVEVPPSGTPGSPPPEVVEPPVTTPDVAGPSAAALVGLAVIVVISAVVLIAAWRGIRRQRRYDERVESVPPPQRAPESLIRATELALHEVVDPKRPPREAIIACFATMEQALERTEFAPLESDTAKEVIDRAVTNGLMPTGPANTLRDLFAEARFSSHDMTPRHQDSAKSALNQALENLRR